jgi:hypothetical protein
MTIQTAKDDDIFARPPRSARRAAPAPQSTPSRRRCVVDGFPADVLLCRECLADVSAARIRARTWLNANLAQGRQIIAAFDALREANQACWDAIEQARSQPDFPAKCARHRAAGNIYAQLLDAHAAMLAGLAPLASERARLEKALSVLEGL